MNRYILKYARYLIVIVLIIFAWVIYQKIVGGKGILPLAIPAVALLIIGTPLFVSLWPRITVSGFKRAIVKRGLGNGPIPVNTLYAVPTVSSPGAPGGNIMATGADDLLYVGGWLDLRRGPQVLHVPDMAGRYYSLQFTDPAKSSNFAYVGKRATGTKAGDYLLTGPRWNGTVPAGMTRISPPTSSALIVGRVLVENDRDLSAAYGLAQQIRLAPFGG